MFFKPSFTDNSYIIKLLAFYPHDKYKDPSKYLSVYPYKRYDALVSYGWNPLHLYVIIYTYYYIGINTLL